MASVLDYSTTAGSNTTVGGVSIAEGMQAGQVNNGMRAMMADSRKWQLDWSGITTAGAGNAYTITSNQGISAYADGQRFSFRADRNNTGAATLNIDSRGAKALRKVSSGALVALGANDLVAKAVYDVVFVSADDVFVIVGVAPPTITAFAATLLDDANAAAMRATLDLEPGTDVQAFNANLASLAGLTLAEGDLLYATAADTLVKLAKGTAGQVLRMNSGATAPEWGPSAAWTWLAAISTPSGSTPADFNIPSTATEILVVFKGTDRGTAGDDLLVRLGTSASFEASGYSQLSGIAGSTGSSGAGSFVVQGGAAGAMRGEMWIKHLGSNEWSQTHTVAHTTTRIATGGGTKTLSDVLTRVRALPSSGNWAGGAVQVGYR